MENILDFLEDRLLVKTEINLFLFPSNEYKIHDIIPEHIMTTLKKYEKTRVDKRYLYFAFGKELFPMLVELMKYLLFSGVFKYPKFYINHHEVPFESLDKSILSFTAKSGPQRITSLNIEIKVFDNTSTLKRRKTIATIILDFEKLELF